jgi:ribosome-associated translation inhibitor RaiA/cold shock CspA family protein
MEIPLEIAFHNLDTSPTLEAEIRKRVGKLEKIYDRLTGCRVSVEKPHRQHRTGNLCEVHIVLRVPNGELAVTHEPHKANERYAAPTVRTVMRDAFKAAELRLKAYKEQLRGDVKPHPAPFHGRVTQVFADRDYAFLLTAEGQQLYFHRGSLMDGDFESLRPGDVVHYIAVDGDTGPSASKVWRGSDSRAG